MIIEDNKEYWYKASYDNILAYFCSLNQKDQEKWVYALFICDYQDQFTKYFEKILLLKIHSLDDNGKKDLLLDKNLLLLLSLINKNKVVNFSYLKEEFSNKKNYYDILAFFYLYRIIDIDELSNFKKDNYLEWQDSIPIFFGNDVNISLITHYLKEGFALEQLVYINEQFKDLFSKKISNLLKTNIIDLLVTEGFNLPKVKSEDLLIITQIYDQLSENKYNPNMFRLSFMIFYYMQSIIMEIYQKGMLKEQLPDILKTYFYHSKDIEKGSHILTLVHQQEEFIDRLNSLNDVNEMRNFVLEYFLFKDSNLGKMDYSLFNQLNLDKYPEYKDLIITLQKLIKSNNLQEIRELAYLFIKDKEIFVKVIRLSYNINLFVEDELNRHLLQVDKKDKIRILDGENFHLLVHVMNAYGDHGDYHNLNNKEGSKQICLSGITDLSVGLAGYTDSVLLGFSYIPTNSLLNMSYRDMGSAYNGYFVDERFSYYASIRKNALVTNIYNEYDIKRDDDFKPSYIVALNTIQDKDKKAAKDLSLPIVLIKEKAYIKRNQQILSNLVTKIENGRLDLIPFYAKMVMQMFYTFAYRNYTGMEIKDEFKKLLDILERNNYGDTDVAVFLRNWPVSFYELSKYTNMSCSIKGHEKN